MMIVPLQLALVRYAVRFPFTVPDTPLIQITGRDSLDRFLADYAVVESAHGDPPTRAIYCFAVLTLATHEPHQLVCVYTRSHKVPDSTTAIANVFVFQQQAFAAFQRDCVSWQSLPMDADLAGALSRAADAAMDAGARALLKG